MRRLLVAVAWAVGLLLAPAGTAAANPIPAPPYVDHTEWVHWGDLSSLRVYPTPAGRDASGRPGAAADEAWAEVLASAPDAAIPGMREQFMCHWNGAEFVAPGKTSWNLEPWRPEVDATQMMAAGCNPGGTEEPF
ncbi:MULTISPECIES: DUF2599 domain-containing protein [unclassified Mycobacterium]|uniref:DUF2599 domain-containing protein n=1 Tax=unclassified Mycobacterium TaxID=2642494 RepID=UPI0029C62C09|nr:MULTISPECIES: DUF2599 domain-containing protein [unclassified Mycobacterium]